MAVALEGDAHPHRPQAQQQQVGEAEQEEEEEWEQGASTDVVPLLSVRSSRGSMSRP